MVGFVGMSRRRRRRGDGDGAAAAAGTRRTHFVRGRSGRSGRVVRGRSGRVVRSGRGRSRGRSRSRSRSLRGDTRPIRSMKPRANPGRGTRRARSDADGPLRQLCRPRTMRSSPPTPPRARARSSRSTRASRRRRMRAPPADGAPHLVATIPRGRGIPTAGARRRRRRRAHERLIPARPRHRRWIRRVVRLLPAPRERPRPLRRRPRSRRPRAHRRERRRARHRAVRIVSFPVPLHRLIVRVHERRVVVAVAEVVARDGLGRTGVYVPVHVQRAERGGGHDPRFRRG